MNWLEISIGIIFLICIITGLIRGAVRIIVSLVATIVTLVIVFFACPESQTVSHRQYNAQFRPTSHNENFTK